MNNTDTGSAGGVGTGTTDVTASTVGPNSALDRNPDARTSAATPTAPSSTNSNQPLPTNRDAELKKYREKQAKKQQKLDKKKKKDETAPASGSQTPAQAPADQGGGTPTTSGTSSPAPAHKLSCHPASAMSRILLADDSPQALRLGEQILTTQGFEVVSVTDGATALRRLPDVNPDLLIADIYLPTRNGFELARFLRSQNDYRAIPVIFAAGPADEFDEQDAKNAGADAILRKPFEASALLGAVQKLLKESAKNVQSGDGKALNSGFDRHAIRAAVTLALDSAMPAMIEELTERVLLALSQERSGR